MKTKASARLARISERIGIVAVKELKESIPLLRRLMNTPKFVKQLEKEGFRFNPAAVDETENDLKRLEATMIPLRSRF